MVLKGIECDLRVLNGNIDELALIAQEQDGKKLKLKLKQIVPEFNSSE